MNLDAEALTNLFLKKLFENSKNLEIMDVYVNFDSVLSLFLFHENFHRISGVSKY